MKRALQAILLLGLCGLSSSGVIAYRDFFGTMGGCPSSGTTGTIAGYPLAIYAFFFSLLIVVVAGVGLFEGREGVWGDGYPAERAG